MRLIRKTLLERHLAGVDRGDKADELHAGGSERVRTEIMQMTGYFHTESSAHASEYMPWFRKNPEMVLEYQPNRWDYYEKCKAHDEDSRVEEFLQGLERTKLEPSHEYGAFIIDSMVTGELRLIHGSVPNRGIISNVSASCSVEVPVAVDREGLRPQIIGELPPVCAAVTRVTANLVELAVEASFSGDRDILYAAVSLDPLTGALLTLPQIRKMVDEMIEAEKQWLPAFESKTLVTAGAEAIAKKVGAEKTGAS